jgi:DNA repair exonuclease SbcCD ATPase subunit
MDAWQEVEKQIATVKAEYIKYTEQNPTLKAKNEQLRNELTEINRQIAVAQGDYKDTIQLDKDLSKEIAKRKTDVDDYVQDKIDSANAKVDKLNTESATRITALDERESKLVERESGIEKQEKVNVVKSKELDASKVILESQAKEIEDATKVLNTQSVDIEHERTMLLNRSVELDTQEAHIAKVDLDIRERIKRLQASESKAQTNLAKSEQLLSTNELRAIEIDKRETFVKNQEEDLKKRELQLKTRTDSFVNSLRAGKMV